MPVPRNYINGIDALVNYRATVESVSYINGTFYADGLWYFYLYALAVKMPAGMLLLFAAALVRALRCRTVSTVVAQLALLLPALAVMCIVSCCTSVQQVRYIIPILPFVFVAIGNVVEARSDVGAWRNRLAAGVTCWIILSSAMAVPHSYSYVNEFAGGSQNGHAHLIGEGYDWGQDLFFVKAWSDSHKDAQPLYAAFYNVTDPGIAGIRSQFPPRSGPTPGWYVLSASILRGERSFRGRATSGSADGDYLSEFLNVTPYERLGYSIFIYHLDCDQANAMRAKLGLELLECDE